MITFINSLSFPTLCILLVTVMCICFVGAYKCKKRGDRTQTILAVIMGVSTIPVILFRYAQELKEISILKDISQVVLYMDLAMIIVSLYVYGLHRYRHEVLSGVEKQKIRAALIGIPVIFLFAIIMVMILGI